MITWILIGLNVLVFVLMALSGAHLYAPLPQTIFDWGGMRVDAIVGGEWWRLISYMFIHIGVVHLVSNMYALLMIGRGLERLMGKGLFIMSYLVTGAFAGLCSFLGHQDTFIVSAGASGAIAGLFGLFFVLLLTPMIERNAGQHLLKQMGIILLVNVSYGLMRGSGVDHYAHIGGLVSGALLGALLALYGYYAVRMPHMRKKLLQGVMVIPVVLLLVVTPAVIDQHRDLSSVRFIELTRVFDEHQRDFEKEWGSIDFKDPSVMVALRIRAIIFPHIEKTEAVAAELDRLELNQKTAIFRDRLKELIALQNQKSLALLKVFEQNDEKALLEFERVSQELDRF